ncbi:hypothetical protein COK47_22890 [Bacillus cereus]|uniref:hypothetical protein n=1 Tax=Bacillus cereus TaxID=1396 RepID=UPI000BF98CAA|nr:hypothetical protein [Bacillus cereus]PFS28822.1 hypothetical protein COK47_22890 [Bacillus cereus]
MRREDCHEENPYDGRTYLYIRTHPDDIGQEPLPAGLPGYVSPDISIINPDGSKGTEAIAGMQNYIEVIVTNNGGIIANDALVEVFYGEPATGFIPTMSQKIGSGYVTVQGYSTASIEIPWIPLHSQTGHLCIIARVSLMMPPDTFRDPNVFDVYGDRHVAQRNISVINLNGESNFSFDVNLVNPFENSGELIFRARFINANSIKRSVDKALGCCFINFSEELFGQIKLEVDEQIRELDENGECYVYVRELTSRKVKIHVQKFNDIANSCEQLHLLEIQLIDPSEQSQLGGLWLLIRP